MKTGLLEGKVALITGTGGDQGRAAALAFAREGAIVVGCDINTDASRQTVAMVEAQGATMRSLEPINLAEPTEARQWVDYAVSEFGGIDILYNNAGALFARGPFAESTLDEWDLTLRNELTLLYVATHAAWKHLIDRGGGVILNTASVSAYLEYMPQRSAAHGATKAGVLAFTRMLAAEGASHGIRAVSISPGLIRTRATQRFFDGTPEQRRTGEKMIAKVPLGRAGECEDISEVAVFLASSRASYINATDILVDGGVRGVSYTAHE